MSDESELMARITIKAGRRSGKPTIRNMRLAVHDILGYLAAGMTREEVLADFDELEPEDIDACFAYAARVIRGTQYAEVA